MTARQIEAWIMRARPGDEIVYHRGHLAADRAVSPAVEASARYALEHSGGQWYEVTPPPCGHIRSVLVGSGELALKQRRVPAAGVTEYLIERR